MNIAKFSLLLFFFSFLFISCKKDLCLQNLPPVVDAGSDTVITLSKLPQASITLSGKADDPDGSVYSYLWSQISGPNTATIADPDLLQLL